METKYPGICIPMMGLHPCYVKENYQEELAIVEGWLAKRKFAAIGEIGLDYKKRIKQPEYKKMGPGLFRLRLEIFCGKRKKNFARLFRNFECLCRSAWKYFFFRCFNKADREIGQIRHRDKFPER